MAHNSRLQTRPADELEEKRHQPALIMPGDVARCMRAKVKERRGRMPPGEAWPKMLWFGERV